MAVGLVFTAIYIIMTAPGLAGMDPFIFDISAQGIGTIGMILNFAVTILVSRFTEPPPPEIQALVDNVRIPEVVSRLKESAAEA
jgi:cation/acetate symporter